MAIERTQNSKPSIPEFWSGLDCVYPVWPWETGQQSLGLSFVSYTAVTGPTCVVVRSQHVEAPHVYNLFSFTRFVVRGRKISCRVDIQSGNWSYWICFSWTPFPPEEFLLDSCGCWLQVLSISFNQKFPVPCGTDPENNHYPSKHWSFQFGPQDLGVTVFTPRLGDLQGPWSWMELQFSPGLPDLGWPEPTSQTNLNSTSLQHASCLICLVSSLNLLNLAGSSLIGGELYLASFPAQSLIPIPGSLYLPLLLISSAHPRLAPGATLCSHYTWVSALGP